MKKFTLSFFSILFVFSVLGADWHTISSSSPAPASKVLISSNIDRSVIQFSLEGFSTTSVTTPAGDAVLLKLEDATPLLEKAAPEVLKLTASVIIPDRASMGVTVIDAEYTEYTDILVAPSKGNLTRDIDPATVPYEYGPVYSSNSFYPGDLASLREPHIVRDFRGQTVVVYPFQYNPVTRTLRVYHSITVELTVLDHDGSNPLIRDAVPSSIDAEFSHIYRGHFLNYSSSQRYDPVPEYGNLLIISYGAFIPEIQSYVDWKEQTGWPVEVVDVASIGNSSAIKTFIADYYNTNGLTFVLLVGDAAQVPSSSTSAGDSDNDYVYIAGNDHYPDAFIGRFSAENSDQLSTQVQRSIQYEQNPPTDIDWFTICTGIASDQGPGDDGEYDYQHIRNIQNNKLLPFTYTYANELFDGSQGGNDAGGNPTPAQVAAAVNAGTTIINYTGHGSNTSWGTSGFSSSDANNLTNDNMLPFVWSVACVNGNFVNTTCFAEAWLRSENNGQPAGAIGFLGSTINQSWNPPMCGQDEMNDVLVETYEDNICRTFAALSMHGCMLMNDEYGSGGDEMTDTWTVFGDPTVFVRTAVPVVLSVSHDPVLLIGTNQMTVTCATNGARATLMSNGSVLATGVVQGGSLTLTYATLSAPGTATLTVTAFNALPYIAQIDIIPADGPYVMFEEYSINDELGNNNNHADYNELVFLDVTMKNVGIEDATDVVVTISTSDPYVTITDDHETFELIQTGQSSSKDNAFEILIADNIPDQHELTFNVSSTDGVSTWESNFQLTLNAPVLEITSILIDDDEFGNGNGQLDPGETADVTFHYENTGHVPASNAVATLDALCGTVEVKTPPVNIASISLFTGANATFEVSVEEDAPVGTLAPLFNRVSSAGISAEKTFNEKISLLIEDFETGDFTKFAWELEGDQPWTVTTQYVYQGVYSAKSGTIGNNQSSELSLTFKVGMADSISFTRKVSSESGDKLSFYINGQMMGEWSGTTGGWKREAYAVTPGIKIFKWVYQKNNSNIGGADCAWLDMITFPAKAALTAWAGLNINNCVDDDVQLQGQATEYTSVEWTTTGSGNFNNPANLSTTYIPSAEDISAGAVTLTLTAWNAQGNSTDDENLVTFITAPVQPPSPMGPDYINSTVTACSIYETEGIEGIADYIWSIEPTEAGDVVNYGNKGIMIWNPEFSGEAMVYVMAENQCGTGPLSEGFQIMVDNLTGISDPPRDMVQLSLMPNPTEGILKVKVSGQVNGNTQLKIIDLLGKEVFSEMFRVNDSMTLTVDLSDIPEGIYLMSMRNDQFRAVSKFIKK